MDEKSGAVFVLKSLDREEISDYNLTVIARDSGHPPLSGSVQLLIEVSDVNDNPPVFFQNNYKVDVEEDTPTGVEILRVKAVSRDFGRNAEVRYKLSEETSRETFSVDETSGNFFLFFFLFLFLLLKLVF